MRVGIAEKEALSLLNTISALLKIRKQLKAFQEGSLKLMEGLPNAVLGYIRELDEERIMVLLNFSEQDIEFPIETSEYIYKLSESDQVQDNAVHLRSFSGVILK